MENYQVVPWINDVLDPGVVANMYVPPGLEMLARVVMERYDMQVYDMVLITSKPDKGGAIWKINTNKGNLSIKCLHRRPRRSLFSIGAQAYMSGLGYRVPSFIPTKEGNYYVEAGGKLWIVTDWIEPLVPVSKIDLEGAAQLCYGLGEFHKNSRGYVPPAGSEKSSRIFGWGKYYEKIISKIGWFKDIALAYPETTASASLLEVIEEFKRQANDIYLRFQNSPYTTMLSKGEPHWGLAHQDFGWSNGQMGPGGIWVIDLDGVSYDLPIRDLRKLITSTMDDMGVWDVTWIRGMIEAYHQANPLDQETFEILWIDMAFPNEFYKHVKEIVFNPIPFLELELGPILQRVLTTETSKWQALAELEKDKANYPAGDYTLDITQPLIIERPASVLPGDLTIPAYSERPYSTPSLPISEPVYSTPSLPISEPAYSTPSLPISEPVFTETPDLVAALPDQEPHYSETTDPIRIPAYSEAEEPYALPFTPKPAFSDAAAEPYAHPLAQEAVYSESSELIAIPYSPTLPGDTTVPVMPAIPMPADFAPVPALVLVPARAKKKFTLRVPKKRRAFRAKPSRKYTVWKKRKLKKLVKWKRRTRYKLIWSNKKQRYIRVIVPIRKTIKKRSKVIKHRYSKPLKKNLQHLARNKKAYPMKKKQLKPKHRTA
ncbi:CotS family spore coat protein [Paenibacillus pectinilyticus]|uniref:CotS family spore coat protein n=1 Tax=Paenibacillus pectinilyticus TaxID=512399 RepID=UPI0009FEB5B4|nr:CotS family spore coat protein [Paenibacillus pectinilyticus]